MSYFYLNTNVLFITSEMLSFMAHPHRVLTVSWKSITTWRAFLSQKTQPSAGAGSGRGVTCFRSQWVHWTRTHSTVHSQVQTEVISQRVSFSLIIKRLNCHVVCFYSSSSWNNCYSWISTPWKCVCFVFLTNRCPRSYPLTSVDMKTQARLPSLFVQTLLPLKVIKHHLSFVSLYSGALDVSSPGI